MIEKLEDQGFNTIRFFAEIFVFLGATLLVIYYWQKRHFYYYASKIPGPFSLPVLGTPQILWAEDFFKAFEKVTESYPSVSKIWIGPYLHVITSRPQDVEIVLTKFLEKSTFYIYFFENVDKALVSAPVNVWRKKRKLLNHSFNPKIINSFHDIFVNYSVNVVKVLDNMCGEEQTDVMTKLWHTIFGIAFETLMDLEPPNPLKINKLISSYISVEQIVLKRLKNLWLCLNPIWKLSSLRKKTEVLATESFNYIRSLVDLIVHQENSTKPDNNELKKKNETNGKLVINSLIHALQDDSMTYEEIVEEITAMGIAGSESTSAAMTCVMLVLGLYPDIQNKVYEEVVSIIGKGDRNATFEDINRMEYLERVIKETLRLLPPAALIARSVDKDIYLDPYVIPAGSDVVIPIMKIHRNPEIWNDPLKFDPDRFLPEEVKKRHRCAFIPFGVGPRNCIGYKYGMMQLKCILPNIIRNFKLTTTKCKSVEEIDLELYIFSKPKNYGIIIEKREKGMVVASK